MNWMQPKCFEPSPLSQNEKPSALSHSGVPRTFVIQNWLLQPFSKENLTALPTLPSTLSERAFSFGAWTRTSSIELTSAPSCGVAATEDDSRSKGKSRCTRRMVGPPQE